MAQDNLEEGVKATFLFRFGAFAEWPPSAFVSGDAPFVICVIGPSSLATLVEQSVAEQRISGHAIEVRRVASAAAGCHILYAGADPQTVRDTLEAVRGLPVLTVTDARFGSERGAIHFVVSDNRVRFHIDRGAARRQGIEINSRLLNIALSVRGGGS